MAYNYLIVAKNPLDKSISKYRKLYGDSSFNTMNTNFLSEKVFVLNIGYMNKTDFEYSYDKYKDAIKHTKELNDYEDYINTLIDEIKNLPINKATNLEDLNLNTLEDMLNLCNALRTLDGFLNNRLLMDFILYNEICANDLWYVEDEGSFKIDKESKVISIASDGGVEIEYERIEEMYYD